MRLLQSLYFLVIFIPFTTLAASFDCSKAYTPIEQAICNNKVLSDLDVEVAAQYSNVRRLRPDIVEDQKLWIKQRNTCQTINCLVSSYTNRIGILSRIYQSSISESKPAQEKTSETATAITEVVHSPSPEQTKPPDVAISAPLENAIRPRQQTPAQAVEERMRPEIAPITAPAVPPRAAPPLASPTPTAQATTQPSSTETQKAAQPEGLGIMARAWQSLAGFLGRFWWVLLVVAGYFVLAKLGERYPRQKEAVFAFLRSAKDALIASLKATSHHLARFLSSLQENNSIQQGASFMDNKTIEKIAAIEQPIGASQGKSGLSRHIWSEVPLDGLILSPPDHDGSPLDIARQVYHRLIARMVSGRVFSLQTYVLFGSIVVALLLSGTLGPGTVKKEISQSDMWGNRGAPVIKESAAPLGATPFVLGILGLGLFIGIAAPAITKNSLSQNMVDETRNIIHRAFVRTLPEHTPDDLRDEFQLTWLTLDGRPLSSEISAEDGKSTEANARSKWWAITGLSVGFAIGSLFLPEIPKKPTASALESLMGTESNALLELVYFVGWAIPAFLFVAKILVDKHPLSKRAAELEVAEAIEGTTFIAAGGVPWGNIPETARKKQVDIAIRDKTPIVELGTATGLFAARGDFFAPNAGIPFVLSLRDLQNHLLVLGGVGSGKTSGVLRPIAQQVGGFDKTGLIVLDGKGALPRELGAIPGLTLIDPASASVSLVSGLDPAILVDTIVEILAPPSASGNDRFWIDSAAGLLRRAAVLAQAAGDKYWSLDSTARVAINQKYRDDVLLAIPKEKGNDPVLLEALEFFKVEWPQIEDRVKSSIIATMRAWISALTASPDLLKWAKTLPSQDTVDITAPLRGGRIGLVLPDYRYGSAGAAATALLKARIYAQLKAHADKGMGENETPVVFLIDEAQEVATSEDATMLAIGRSLELAVIAATQSIEGIKVKLGEAVSAKWLSIYGGVIALPGRSRETDDFVAARGGESWKASVSDVYGLPVRDSLIVDSLSGAMAAARRQPHMQNAATSGKVAFLPSRIQAIVAQTLTGGRSGRDNPARVSLGVKPILAGSEIANLLAEPDTAVALTTRARAPRRDVIWLKPIYPSSH